MDLEDPEVQAKIMDDAKEFHMIMGFCIARWAHIDDLLFDIFRACVGPVKQCAVIYYRQPGIDVRYGLVDEVLAVTLPQHSPGKHPHSTVKAWKKAREGWKDLISTRRRIAHHGVWTSTQITLNLDDDPIGPVSESTSYKLYANNYERSRNRKSDQGALTIVELKQHLLDMYNLQGRIQRFYDQVLIKHLEITSAP